MTNPSRTTVASIELSKSFDCIPIHLTIQKISSSNLHPNITIWLSCYLRGRMAFYSYKNTNPSHKIIHTGVPQGSVISPVLFNFFIADAHHLPSANTSSYADDLLPLLSLHLPVSWIHKFLPFHHCWLSKELSILLPKHYKTILSQLKSINVVPHSKATSTQSMHLLLLTG